MCYLMISLAVLCGYVLFFLMRRGRGKADARILFWTTAFICRFFGVVIFVCFNSGEFNFSLSGVKNGAVMLAFMLVLVCIFELCAPSNRFSTMFRKKNGEELPHKRRGEERFDGFYRLVCDILSGFLCALPLLLIPAAAMSTTDFTMLSDGMTAISGVCLVVTSAVSARQLIYALSLEKTAAPEDSDSLSTQAERFIRSRSKRL